MEEGHMFNHDDYMTYHLHCAEFNDRDVLRAGDVVWAPSPDSFNPWRELVRIHTVRQHGWFSVQTVGANDALGTPQLRWYADSERFWAARTMEETALAVSEQR